MSAYQTVNLTLLNQLSMITVTRKVELETGYFEPNTCDSENGKFVLLKLLEGACKKRNNVILSAKLKHECKSN